MVELRDERYDQIVHMVTSAQGAESFYQLANNSARSEGLELARELDAKVAQVSGYLHIHYGLAGTLVHVAAEHPSLLAVRNINVLTTA